MASSRNQFPDFFTTKGPIPTKVTSVQFGKRIYYQSKILTEDMQFEPAKPQLKPYLDNDDEMLDCGDMGDSYDITLTKTGKFQTSFYVPSALLSYIIGAKGSKLKNLQRNTNTLIKIPRINEKGDIMIQGDSERKVASARTQIALIVTQRKQNMPPSHFVAIPINSDEIRTNLLEFQKNVLENPPKGVSRSLFQKPVKLHLTIVMLTLLDEEELECAKKTLDSCYKEHISTIFRKSEKVVVRGLEIMNDDPSNVYVMYAKIEMKKVELNEKLQEVADKILHQFGRTNLAKKEYDTVKLHMTVMNTSFRESGEEKGSFDAREILDKYGDFYFGEFDFNQLDLCIRGTTTSSTGEPKYYDTALKITF